MQLQSETTLEQSSESVSDIPRQHTTPSVKSTIKVIPKSEKEPD